MGVLPSFVLSLNVEHSRFVSPDGKQLFESKWSLRHDGNATPEEAMTWLRAHAATDGERKIVAHVEKTDDFNSRVSLLICREVG